MTKVSFESSIESFAYPRLQRMGKNVKVNFMEEIIARLQKILAVCPSTIILDRIALDPTISPLKN
jgi:hypothetical protein